MKKLYGNAGGIKATMVSRLENLYRRRTSPDYVVPSDLAFELAEISCEIRRQVAILVNRLGRVAYVIVGDSQRIVIPDTLDYRIFPGQLKGLKCIHTHLKDEALTDEDLTDLALLRLDVMAVITIGESGVPLNIHVGHVRPGIEGLPYKVLPPLDPGLLDIGCLDLIRKIETELKSSGAFYEAEEGEERAILVSVATGSRAEAWNSMAELSELARSSDIAVLDTVLQQRRKVDPRFVMGRGKLNELTILALRKGATLLIFDQELNSAQIRSITDRIEMKVIDRTQLILDIFARRAQTREGQLQVELAQLKYMLPRLATKNTAMSRLTGGIGGRGPGETKLEINRRRVRDRINRLQKSLKEVKKHRKQQKSKRNKRGVPVISIVGYTNAGKSTLLNTLTQSHILAEDRLFATLDPSSRRLRFPRDQEVIITDTVGFIRDLPAELMVSFRATLEELAGADLLLHVIDISNPRHRDQIASVEKILADLDLDRIPAIHVLNKEDRLDEEAREVISNRMDGFLVSARKRATLVPLLEKMEEMVGSGQPAY